LKGLNKGKVFFSAVWLNKKQVGSQASSIEGIIQSTCFIYACW